MNIIKKYFSKENAFTMIELLVVTSIIGLLTVSVLLSFRNSNNKYLLDQTAQQFVSDLRRVQNMALSGVDFNGKDSYGIYTVDNASSYIIYIDNNGNHTYQSSADTIVETINLDENITVNAISPSSSRFDVFFESPDPDTYINGNSNSALGVIVFSVDGTSQTRSVVVNTSGLIEGN